jgi:hypothetical protein
LVLENQNENEPENPNFKQSGGPGKARAVFPERSSPATGKDSLFFPVPQIGTNVPFSTCHRAAHAGY